ncbi:MAG: hypothetical protein WKF88_06080 [Ferruginibacter sp.]
MEDIKLDEIREREILQGPVKKKSGFKSFMKKFFLILVLLAGAWIWWQYFYVFGIGVKSGTLNYVVKKGNVFKTYEGKLIQNRFRSKIPGVSVPKRLSFQ